MLSLKEKVGRSSANTVARMVTIKFKLLKIAIKIVKVMLVNR